MKLSINYQKELILCIFFSLTCFISQNIIQMVNSTIINSFSQMLIVLFYFIEKKNESIMNINQKEIIMKFIKEKDNFPKFTITILIISYNILNLISSITVYSKIGNLGYFFNIIFVFIIDGIFFKNKIHSHHLLSIILNLIACFIYIYINWSKFSNIFIWIIIFLNCYSFNFSICLTKYINTKYFINIFLLGSLPGLIRFIYLIIKKKYTNDFPLFGILYFFLRLSYYFFFYLIIFKFNAQHIVILIQIMTGLLQIKQTQHYNLLIISIIISLISGLIYIEILVLNFCNLSENVKKNIEQRGLRETYLISKKKVEISSSNESYTEESFNNESFYSQEIKNYEKQSEN